MQRFFADILGTPNEIILCGENAHHMEHVLRLRAGESFVVCDGRGTDYVCRLTRYASKQAYAEVAEVMPNTAEPLFPVVLFQGIPKADKMEMIIQKAVELGVTKIVPVSMERCVVKLGGKEAAKVERWQKIAESAAKQSHRGCVPVVEMPVTLAQGIAETQMLSCRAVAYENEKTHGLREYLSARAKTECTGFGIFIGPEGGLAPEEIARLESAGIAPVSLGRRILRTETAGLYALAAVGFAWDV